MMDSNRISGDNDEIQRPQQEDQASHPLNSEERLPSDESGWMDKEIGDDEASSISESKDASMNALKAKHRVLFDALKSQVAQDDTAAASTAEDKRVLSLRAIMAGQRSEKIITNPRDYQLELFRRAKNQNTIAVLDTGSGKTLIAVLLLKHVIDEDLERRALGESPRIAVFLTGTVALAFQQHRVLLSNLDQPIELIVGDMAPQTWPKTYWKDLLTHTMVLVCTPAVLLNVLFRSYITMNDISLLIFDEAHHTKKNHAYARIVKDFYITQRDHVKRPRIFGMTASPVDVDVRDNLIDKAKELETLLHSKIATASDISLFRTVVARPKVTILYFEALNRGSQSLLYQQLRSHFINIFEFKPMFLRASQVSSELGFWCSDQYWKLALSEKAVQRRENKLHQANPTSLPSRSVADLDAEIEPFQRARDMIQTHFQSDDLPTTSLPSISPKVKKLFQLLNKEFHGPTSSKCLIFVERKDTTRLLFELCQYLGSTFLKPGIITGATSDRVNTSTNSVREQAITMLKFRNTEMNCLFATSVAEEGIDVPDCNLVIRFDLCKTLIQYIQSRGRARHKSSRFVHLVERQNSKQELALRDLLDAEQSLENLCRSLPEDRLIGFEDDSVAAMKALELEVASDRTYVEEQTGAKLTYDFSLVILQHFVSCIPHDPEDDLSINYIAIRQADKYTCEVVLPPKSPVQSAMGMAYSRKAQAKRSAAFEACIMLRKQNYLDAYFLPTYAKRLPAMRNARLGLDIGQSTTYKIQNKPSVWLEHVGSVPTALYLTIITLGAQWDRSVRAIGILTRSKMPQLPSFPAFRVTGEVCPIHLVCLQTAYEVSTTHIEYLTWFNLTVLKDLYNKKFENSSSSFPYWLVPLSHLATDTFDQFGEPSALIDWSYLSSIYMQEHLHWTEDMPHEQLLNKFLIDPWDGGRRVFTWKVASELCPCDPVPEGVAQSNRMDTILEYSVSLFKRSRMKASWSQHQPVIQGERLMHRLSILRTPSEEERNAVTKCFICPEPFLISLLPCDLVASCLLFPAVIHRLESYLIALEMCSVTNITATPALALEAVTKDTDNSTGSEMDRIEESSGMGPNYERLEFIGDCFLKMATSISVFVNHSGDDEFAMHVTRMCMLCNKNLFDNAKRNEWYKYIRCEPFSRRRWYPPNIKLLEGKGAKTQEQQAPVSKVLGDKTVADVCEAMIGAALMTFIDRGFTHIEQFDNAVHAVSVFVDSEDHRMQKWSDYYEAYKVPSYQTEESTASQRNLVEKLAQEQGYRFRYPRLARSAFTHPSQPRMIEKIPSYQRLEFLGDSLLDMVAVDYLFRRYPDKGPHWLTENKTVMISNRFLGALCVELGFHKHLRHSQPSLETAIRQFVDDIEAAKAQAQNATDYWTRVKEVPKCLSDIVESYIGAIFVDSEFDFGSVQKFFDGYVRSFFEDMSVYEDFAQSHPITKLHHLLEKDMSCNNYHLMASEMPSVDAIGSVAVAAVFVHDVVVSQCRAKTSPRDAKIQAAQAAVRKLETKSRDIFRTEYRCDCRTGED